MMPSESPANRDVLTVEDVACYLKVTERHIYKLLSKRRLPAFKVGGVWRFRKADLEDWMSSGVKSMSVRGGKK